jgi:hypothetical protein
VNTLTRMMLAAAAATVACDSRVNEAIKASCDCAFADGGLSPTPFEYGKTIYCETSHDAVQQACDYAVRQVQSGAGGPFVDCRPVIRTCHCVMETSRSCD